MQVSVQREAAGHATVQVVVYHNVLPEVVELEHDLIQLHILHVHPAMDHDAVLLSAVQQSVPVYAASRSAQRERIDVDPVVLGGAQLSVQVLHQDTVLAKATDIGGELEHGELQGEEVEGFGVCSGVCGGAPLRELVQIKVGGAHAAFDVLVHQIIIQEVAQVQVGREVAPAHGELQALQGDAAAGIGEHATIELLERWQVVHPHGEAIKVSVADEALVREGVALHCSRTFEHQVAHHLLLDAVVNERLAIVYKQFLGIEVGAA